MSCEHLVCASCAGPVVEGRCPVCRASRSEVHSHGGAFGLSPQTIVAALVVALVVLLVLAHAGF
jgi:ferredoxin